MPSIKPHIIVPNLIEQPTWGGDYISTHKNITDPVISSMKLGQSYELYQDSFLSTKTSSQHNPSLELASPNDPANTSQHLHNDKPIKLSSLIKQNPDAVLGKNFTKNKLSKNNILIKLNQARGNSYQLHTNRKDPHWLPKPESWFFLNPGLITLGVKPDIDWNEYQNVCQLIEAQANLLSRKINGGQLSVVEARKKLSTIINLKNPSSFVNLINVPKFQAIDLSAGAIHHSWEENPTTHPNGNIVYEVQLNVYDPVSTIRAFDKGKIQNDGSVRPVHIQDYFAHIDRSQAANNPAKLRKKLIILKKTSTQTIKQVFSTKYYSLELLSFTKPLSNKYTTTSHSFHHLFAQKGNFKISSAKTTLTITQGYSAFIPASAGRYQIKPFRSKSTHILKTFLQ